MSLKKRLYFQVIFATVIWGAAYPFTKYVINEISPVTLVFIRALAASVFLYYMVKPKIKLYLNKDILSKLLLMSILGVSLQQYTQAYALKYTLATNAGWLIALTPILVVFLSLFAGEKISFLKLSGFIFGFIGTIMIIFSKTDFKSFSFLSLKGDLIFLSSCLAWAYYVILTKKWFLNYKQSEITALTMLIATLTVLPFFISGNHYKELHNLSFKAIMCLFYLAILSSTFAYLFWNNSVEGLGPVKSSYFIYDEPFATVISAYIVLNETLEINVFIGGIFILLGVFCVQSFNSDVSFHDLYRTIKRRVECHTLK